MAETFQQYVTRLTGLVGSREPVDILRSTADRVSRLIAAHSVADLRRKPAPDRWSVAEILAHLADAEIVAAYRFRMILSAPGTPIQAFDQNKWAGVLRYADQDPFESLALFRAVRSSFLALVERLEESQLDAFGVHEERGQETIGYLIRLYAGHDLNHLAQIETLTA